MREVRAGLPIVNHFDVPMRVGAVPPQQFVREPAEMSQVSYCKMRGCSIEPGWRNWQTHRT